MVGWLAGANNRMRGRIARLGLNAGRGGAR
jgi:hypothetical protein